MDEIDAGLAILRLAVGLLIAGHGLQKLFGWFGGPGPDGTSQWMESVGLGPGTVMATLAGGCETIGGLLVALGLFHPLGSAMALGVMLVAIATHTSHGLWNQQGGYEFPLTLAAVATGLAFTGPGQVSLDHALGFERIGSWWGTVAVVAAMVAAAPILLRRADTLRQPVGERST